MSRFVSPYSDALSLRELLPEAELLGGRDVRVRACACDSLTCQPGDVFVALAGSRTRRPRVRRRSRGPRRGGGGCRPSRISIDVPTCLVLDSSDAFGRICQALAGRPSQRLNVIGVTGTNGKSTTTALIHSVLAAAGRRTGSWARWDIATALIPCRPN